MQWKFSSRPTLVIFLALGALSCCEAGADDKPLDELSGWQRLFREHADGYRFVVDGKKEAEVRLVPKPVLQWSQPVRGGADGAVYVWTQEGRPVAIGTLFIWPMEDGRQGVTHELHSLSTAPFVATWRERRWTPPADSIAWQPLSGMRAPAATAEQRLRQMRDGARQFQAESTDKKDQKWELRLLPRPIYRYELDSEKAPPERDREVSDGALFGFVEGTDLEVVLAVQARISTNGPQWEYALARMSDFRLKVSLGGKTVWEVDRTGFDNPRVAYYCSTVEARTSAEEK
jgi:hypothetical protein